MAHSIKKRLSLVLAILLIFTSCAVAFNVTAAGDTLVEDDFSSSALTNWTSSSVGTVKDGKYTIKYDGANFVKGIGGTANYAVSADVSASVAVADNGFDVGGSAYIVARANNDMTEGYEFGISVSTNGGAYLRLYRRGKDSSTILKQDSSVAGVGTIKPDTAYNLKLVAAGNIIICYINDVLYCNIPDTTYSSGNAGVHNIAAVGTYDNFKVDFVPEQKVDSITVTSHSDSISKVGKLYFDIDVKYNSVYGSISLNQDSEGVTFTGLDGKAGKKTITVSYLNASTTFDVNVTEKFISETLYVNEFNSEKDFDDFNGHSNVVAGKTLTYYIKDGKARVDIPKDIGNNPASVMMILPTAMFQGITAYSVTADVYTYSNHPENASTPRAGESSLILANGNGSRYELRAQGVNGQVRIYKDGAIMYSVKADAIGISMEAGKKINLRANVYPAYVELFVQGKKIYTDLNMGPSYGPMIGVASHNGDCAYDRLEVTSLEEKGTYAITKMDPVASDDSVMTKITANDFDPTTCVLKLYYSDGSYGYTSVKEDMVSGYTPGAKKNQNITITYAGKTATIQFVYVPYLFYEDYESGFNTRWTLGSDPDSPYEIVNGRLKFDYTSTVGRNSSVNHYIKGTETLEDYTISADVFFDNRSVSATRTRYFGFLIRRKDNQNYYRVALTCNGAGTISMVITRWESGASTSVLTVSNGQLQTALSRAALKTGATQKSLSTGVQYNLQVTVAGSKIKCYFEGVQVAIYDDPSPHLYGGCAIQNIASITYVDNVIVKKASSQISKAALSGVENDTIEIYKGGDISPWEHTLDVYMADGSVDQITLQAEMIGAYDNMSLGTQKVKITDGEAVANVNLVVKERPDYIKDVDKALCDFGGVKSESDFAAFAALKEKYDSLTPWETTQLSENAVKNYDNFNKQYDAVLYGDIIGDDELLWSSYFNTYDDDKDWTNNAGGESSGGFFFGRGGALWYACRSYSMSKTGYAAPKQVFGSLSMVSCDFKLINTDVFCGVAINMQSAGYYHIRISSKTRDEQERTTYTLQLLKKADGAHKTLQSTLTEVNGVQLHENEWFNLTVTFKDGVVAAFVNGVRMLSINDDDAPFSFGECGARLSEGDVLLDNFRVYGTAIEREKKREKVITPTKYTDNFDDEKAGEDPSHWIEDSTSAKLYNNWKVYKKDNNLCYGTENTSGKVTTWLHVFDNDPTYSLKFMVGSAKANAKVGFITRQAPRTCYLDIGYDFAKKQWYAVAQEIEQEGEKYYYADKTSDLATNKWYTVDITEKGGNVSVKLDGTTVLELTDVIRTAYGRVGVFAENASMFIDDVNCTFASGDYALDGIVSHSVIDEERYAGHMEIESAGGNKLVGVNYDTIEYVSYDKGQTWVDTTKDRQYPGLTFGSYPSILELKDGSFIKFKYTGDDLYCEKSTDHMKTWSYCGQVAPPEEQANALGQRNAIWHVNSATEYTLKDGTNRIFMPIGFRNYSADGVSILGHHTKFYYSDDGGKTWTHSITTTETLQPGYDPNGRFTCCELKVIQCSDGTLRVYYPRNYYGCMQYFVSYDEGVTWEGIYQIPEIQQPMTSYAVMEDKYNPGTYYMLTLLGAADYLGSIFPRNTLSLLKSTDGKNWEFQTYLERMDETWSPTNGTAIYQILDPSLWIDEDYVYCTFGRSEREYSKFDANSHQAQRVNYYKLKKSSLVSRPWDSSNIPDMEYPKSIVLKDVPQTKFGLGDLFTAYGTIELTNFYGEKTVEDLKLNCKIYEQPNMFKLGKQTVKLYYSNASMMSYEIEIVPNYTITWDIYGDGTVSPEDTRIMEGATKEFTLTPAKGNKVAAVFVNGEKVSVKKNKFTIKDAKENYEIEVDFAPLSILDYWYFIVLGVVVLAAAALAVILVIRKKRSGK